MIRLDEPSFDEFPGLDDKALQLAHLYSHNVDAYSGYAEIVSMGTRALWAAMSVWAQTVRLALHAKGVNTIEEDGEDEVTSIALCLVILLWYGDADEAAELYLKNAWRAADVGAAVLAMASAALEAARSGAGPVRMN